MIKTYITNSWDPMVEVSDGSGDYVTKEDYEKEHNACGYWFTEANKTWNSLVKAQARIQELEHQLEVLAEEAAGEDL